jgi:hypothetical protein
MILETNLSLSDGGDTSLAEIETNHLKKFLTYIASVN